MANTNPEKFSPGYGDKAYAHAKKDLPPGGENWIRKTADINALRQNEYQKRLDGFKKKMKLQTVNGLSGMDEYTFEKGDTLYPVLKEQFGMNEHTAFFVMIKMMENGVNVDRWQVGDKIGVDIDGSVYMTRRGKEINISNVLMEMSDEEADALDPTMGEVPKDQQ